MRFFIILSGDELIEGRQQDANGSYLASHMCALGFAPGGVVFVGDDRELLARTIRGALDHYDAVICSGGLGGTADDLTRFALSDAVASPLVVNEEAMAALRAFWARLRREFPSDRPLEAMMPASATMVANNAGLAPGMLVADGSSRILCLPGVPSELRHMVEEGALDLLGAPAGAHAEATLRVVGMREPVVAQVLGEIMDRGRNPLCGIAAKIGEIQLSLRANAETREAANALIAADVVRIQALLGDKLYSVDGRDHIEIIAEALRAENQTLAVAESLTGGLMGHRLTEVSGISDVFVAGFVTYANEAKVRTLGVKETTLEMVGAVSEEVAVEMARGALMAAGSDYAVATTGIAGPRGGSEAKPVGTCWVAAACNDGRVMAEMRVHGGSRQEIKRRSVTQALDLVRRLILRV